MSERFDSWVNFNLRSSTVFSRNDEVEEFARGRLAEQVERNIRTQIDPGIDRKSGVAAGQVKVRAEDDRLVIYSDNPADVLRSSSKQVKGGANPNEASGVEELFKQSSGVPSVHTRPDGSTGLSFKQISVDNLFQEQRAQQQNERIEQSVTETVRSGIVGAYEDAWAEIARRHPEDQ